MSSTGIPANAGGVITGCLVDKTLPTGMALSPTTCAITGQPTVITASDTYTITPSNAVGSGMPIVLTLEVVNVPPDIAFAGSPYVFDVMSAATTGVPTNTGGAATGCAFDVVLPAGLSISATTCEISGTPNVVTAAGNYVITASNGAGTATPRTISIEVRNVPPQIAYSAATYIFDLHDAAATSGTPTASGGAITNCLVSPPLPAGLTLDAGTCAISGNPSAVTAMAIYTITPSNAAGNGTARNLQIEVSNVVPDIAFSGAPYRFNIRSADSTGTPANTGGAITNCLVSPTLPAGLTISTSNCTISGTPTDVTGSTTYTVTPSNAVGSGTARTIDIETPNVAPAIAYSPSSFTFSLNAGVTGTLSPANSGGAITSCTSDITLPAGISLNQTTCRIEGTPTAVQASTAYQITATNAIGSSSAVTIHIRVNNVVPAIAYSSASYGFNVHAAGSTTGIPTNTGGAITGCVADGTLPNGMTLSATTCELSGTPTNVQPATTYRITARNGVGDANIVQVTIEIRNIVPNISFAGSPFSWTENTSVSTGDPSNTGGAITSCAISSALSTAGLTFNTSTCKINGTPTATLAATNYTITASNAIGSGSGVVISLAVASACAHGSQVFGYTGTSQAFSVPSGCTSMTIKAWGGGGAGTSKGGGGGFATSTHAVTAMQSFNIMVGGAGVKSGISGTSNGTYGGGGAGGWDDDGMTFGSSGGGRSEVRLGGTTLLIAGGGGGSGSGQDGGPGGGSSGSAGSNSGCTKPGGGGTSSAGGAAGGAGATAGASGVGGTGVASTSMTIPGGGGGGGGGYYGGGGGGSNHPIYCGGGGGSSYSAGSSVTLTSGSGKNPGNASDVDYGNSAGLGGEGVMNNAFPGRVVIIY